MLGGGGGQGQIEGGLKIFLIYTYTILRFTMTRNKSKNIMHDIMLLII